MEKKNRVRKWWSEPTTLPESIAGLFAYVILVGLTWVLAFTAASVVAQHPWVAITLFILLVVDYGFIMAILTKLNR